MLRAGKTKSCGCLRRENTAALKRTHGHGRAGADRKPEYIVWLRIKQCCTNPKNPSYEHYGARGITVCDRWMQSFADFYADMGPKPTDKRGRHRDLYSLDRIDNDGPYAPENCKWATQTEQRNNSRATRKITLNGRTQTVTEWERERGLPTSMIRQRLNAGWSVERAITTPPEHHYGRHLL